MGHESCERGERKERGREGKMGGGEMEGRRDGMSMKWLYEKRNKRREK